MTNNLHVYTDNNSKYTPEKWMVGTYDLYGVNTSAELFSPYNRADFDQDCRLLMGWEALDFDPETLVTEFVRWVAYPMCRAYACHRSREYGVAKAALDPLKGVGDDWREDALRWLTRRETAFKLKQQRIKEGLEDATSQDQS
jgi:hypothetical protein